MFATPTEAGEPDPDLLPGIGRSQVMVCVYACVCLFVCVDVWVWIYVIVYVCIHVCT